MAACTLKIELDDPFETRQGGQQLSGTINVQCHKDTKCNDLEVRTEWRTHGRGNVDSGICETASLYSGQWQAGQTYRYPFKLDCAAWPTTYNGSFLNVRHAVLAQAKIPWATDPKASFEFPVVARESPLDLKPVRAQSTGGAYIGWIIGGILLLVFGFVFLWLVPILLLIAGLFWFFNSYLPKLMTGKVECEVLPTRAKPGTVLQGKLSFTPRRRLSINGVRYRIRCLEKCVSGSGSNRQTHTHEIVDVTHTLAEGQLLPAKQLLSYRFEYPLPQHAAPSMTLSDNELKWSVEMRIDIPRWPDFAKEVEVIVEPGDQVVTTLAGGFEAAQPLTADDQWLREVLEQLEQSATDAERRSLVLGAIREHQFKMTLMLDEAVSPAPATSPGAGNWYEGVLVEPDWSVYLFVPAGRPAPALETRFATSVTIADYKPHDEALVLHMQ